MAFILPAVGVLLASTMVAYASVKSPHSKEAAVDQNVVDSWTYAGVKDNKYLVFKNSTQTVYLPKNEKTFAIDGKHIHVDSNNSKSITFTLQ